MNVSINIPNWTIIKHSLIKFFYANLMLRIRIHEHPDINILPCINILYHVPWGILWNPPVSDSMNNFAPALCDRFLTTLWGQLMRWTREPTSLYAGPTSCLPTAAVQPWGFPQRHLCTLFQQRYNKHTVVFQWCVTRNIQEMESSRSNPKKPLINEICVHVLAFVFV